MFNCNKVLKDVSINASVYLTDIRNPIRTRDQINSFLVFWLNRVFLVFRVNKVFHEFPHILILMMSLS